MPSPYATQRPTTTRASLLERAHDLSREAGLADPGRPDDRGEPARRLSHRGLERVAELVELSSRPMKGVTMGRAKAGTSGRKPSNLQAASGWLFPFASTAAPARRRRHPRRGGSVAWPMSTSPACAACSSRAATLTASPVASF